jgi:EmrB/QacA subfamily drug resistance transporter
MTDARKTAALAFLVAGAFFMENLDGTVIANALPQMARSLRTDVVGLNVGITAYLLALSVFVPMSGWVADRFGARTVFASAIAVFTLSSVLCGFAGSLAAFTGFRVIQGLGGAMMVPIGRLVVLRNTEKRDLVRAIATITWPGLVAPILGPPVGGFIVEHATWRWIFFLNVPLGIVAFALALWLVPNLREPERTPFDWTGFLLVGLACTLIMVGLGRVEGGQIPWVLVGGLIAAGLGLGTLAVRYLRRAEHPLVPLGALRIQTFALTIYSASFFRCAIGATPFLLPLLFQVGFGLSPTRSGLLVLWVFAGNLAMKPATTGILKLLGFRTTLLLNGLLATLALLAVVLLTPATPYPIVAFVLFTGGLFRSMQFTALGTIGFADVPAEEMSGANSLATTVGGLTFGLGVATGAIGLRLGAWLNHNRSDVPTLPDFRVAFIAVAALVLLSLYDSLRLPHDAGREVSGHKA